MIKKLIYFFTFINLFLSLNLLNCQYKDVKSNIIYISIKDSSVAPTLYRIPPHRVSSIEVKIEEPQYFEFDPYDITKPSNLTKAELSEYLSVYCKYWVGLEDFLLLKDKEMNLIFLLSVAKTETGAGQITHGSYNCFNIRQENSYAFVNYNSYEESIEDFIYLILKGYVAEDGIWYEEPWYDYSGNYHTSTSIHTIGLHYAGEIWAPYIENIGYEIKHFAENVKGD